MIINLNLLITAVCIFIIILSIAVSLLLILNTGISHRNAPKHIIILIPFALLMLLLFLFWFSKFDNSLLHYFIPYDNIVSIASIAVFLEILFYGIITHRNQFRKLFGLAGLYGLSVLPCISKKEFPVFFSTWLLCCILSYVIVNRCGWKWTL